MNVDWKRKQHCWKVGYIIFLSFLQLSDSFDGWSIPSFLTVTSELHQKELMSKHGLNSLLHLHLARFSSKHWLDYLVRCQSSKSSDIRAKTFDTLKRYSVTEFGKNREEKVAGLVKHLSYLLEWNVSVLCNQQHVAYMWQSKLECDNRLMSQNSFLDIQYSKKFC